MDGDRIDGDFALAQGRVEIAKQYEATFATRKADPSTIPFHAKLSIRLVRPDVAILDGEWEGRKAGKRIRGHFTEISTKEAGIWQIAAGRLRGTLEP